MTSSQGGGFTRRERSKCKPEEIKEMVQKQLEENKSRVKDKSPYIANTEVGLATELPPLNFVSSGVKSVDHLLGGGFPTGRITMIYGPYHSGKTSLCLLSTAANQQRGLRIVWIDSENKFNLQFAANLGVNVKDLIVAHPASLENLFQLIIELSKDTSSTTNPDIIVVDSVALLSDNENYKKQNLETSALGIQAQIFKKNLAILQPLIAQSNIALILVNQIRFKIGTLFGNPEDFPGGNSLKHSTTLQLRVSQASQDCFTKDFADGSRTGVHGSKLSIKTDCIHGRNNDKVINGINFVPEAWWYIAYNEGDKPYLMESNDSLCKSASINRKVLPKRGGKGIVYEVNGKDCGRTEAAKLIQEINPLFDVSYETLGDISESKDERLPTAQAKGAEKNKTNNGTKPSTKGKPKKNS